MKLYLLILSILFFSYNQEVILLKNITVIAIENGKTFVADVLIEDGIFSEISRNSIEKPDNALLINGQNKFIIPGLWDMHTHLDDPEMWSLNLDQTAKEDLLILLVANGITGVRDTGGNLNQLIEWRNKIKKGKLIGPTITFSGPILDGNPPSWPGSIVIENKDDVKKAISRLKNQGADFIKIYSSLSTESFYHIMDYANERNMSVVGHIPMAMGIEEASNAGQKSIEHMTGLLYASTKKRDIYFNQITNSINSSNMDWSTYLGSNPDVIANFDEKTCVDILKILAKNKTWQVPTLRTIWGLANANEVSLATDTRIGLHSKVYQRYWNQSHQRLAANPESVITYRNQTKLMMRITKLMHKNGVPLLAGTDMSALPFVFAGSSLHEELVLMVDAGLTPLQALQTATINPAKYFRKTDSFGSIKEDLKADYIILNKNPLDNIKYTQEIYAVGLNGQFYDQKKINSLINRLKAKYK